MSNMSWASLLNANGYSQTQVGSALANSTTITDVSPGGNTAGQAFTIPASFLQSGQQWRVRANGIVSTTGTPTLTLGLYLGGVAGTALATTGAVATASGLSNACWTLDLDLRVDGVGTSGAIRSIGKVIGINGTQLMPATSSSGNSVAVNTSVANPLTLGATWGTASASNSLQVIQYAVELLN